MLYEYCKKKLIHHTYNLPSLKLTVFAPKNGWLQYFFRFLMGPGLFSGAMSISGCKPTSKFHPKRSTEMWKKMLPPNPGGWYVRTRKTINPNKNTISGWWLNHPSEKYLSNWKSSPILGVKLKKYLKPPPIIVGIYWVSVFCISLVGESGAPPGPSLTSTVSGFGAAGFAEAFDDTVGGSVHQLRMVIYPIIYKILYIPGGAGFLNHQQYAWNVTHQSALKLRLKCSYMESI